MSARMDNMLDEFLRASSSQEEQESRGNAGRGKGLKGKKNRVEGVWVSADGSHPSLEEQRSSVHDAENGPKEVEDDEMIWWTWEGGKIVGFVDW
jgi:hypothetical protein